MKRISAGGAGGVGVRERGAAVALAALPRLQLELTPSLGTPVCDPLVRLKLKRLLPPSGPLNEPGGRVGDRNPEYRDADERRIGERDQQHSGLAGDGVTRIVAIS